MPATSVEEVMETSTWVLVTPGGTGKETVTVEAVWPHLKPAGFMAASAAARTLQ